MNNRSRFFLLVLLVALIAILIIANPKEPKNFASFSNNSVDLTKMLQYGEKVQDIRVADRDGHVFDLAALCNKPLLLVFVRDNLENIQAFNDSLHKHLRQHIAKGMSIVFINRCGDLLTSKSYEKGGATVFCDNELSSLFNAFKVNNHSSCIILNKNHKVILSTVSIVRPTDLEKIVHHKETDIFL